MNAKKIIVMAVLLTFISGTAAEAFPFFGGSDYGYGNGYGNYGGWGGHCHHHRHHHHRRGWGW